MPKDDAILLPFDSESATDLPADPSHPHAAEPEAGNTIAGEISLAGGVLYRDHPQRFGLGEVQPAALGLLVGIVVVR